MSTRRDSLDLESLTAQLRSLTINITVINDPRSSSSVPTVVTSTGSAPPTADSGSASSRPTSSRDDTQVSGLTWAQRTTSATCPPSVLCLASHLHASGEDRIRAAYLRGREAASIARGEQGGFVSDSRGGRRVCYVVLLCEDIFEKCLFQGSAYWSRRQLGP